jgi:hypothetical protein
LWIDGAVEKAFQIVEVGDIRGVGGRDKKCLAFFADGDHLVQRRHGGLDHVADSLGNLAIREPDHWDSQLIREPFRNVALTDVPHSDEDLAQPAISERRLLSVDGLVELLLGYDTPFDQRLAEKTIPARTWGLSTHIRRKLCHGPSPSS